MILQRTSDWGGARTNGKVRYRRGGKFVKTPSLGGFGCPNCNRIILPQVNPEYVSGFINPASMRPTYPDNCHGCGINFKQYEADQQVDNWINALLALSA